MFLNKSTSFATGFILCLASTAAYAEPLKIGILESLSGSQASSGRLYASAIRYGVGEINKAGGFNGAPIEIVEYDNGGDASGAAAKLQQAATDGIHIVMQGASSAIAGQISNDVRKYNIRNKGKEMVFVNVGAAASELRGASCNFYTFHFTFTAPMIAGALAQTMSKDGTLGKRVFSINQNYSWGQDMEKAIKANAAKYGYTVVDSVLHDVNRIQDFAPYVAKINAAKPDSVLTANWSNDLLLLMKATGNAGLKVTFGTAYLDQPGNIANAGPIALGHYVANAYNIESGNTDFLDPYKAATGHVPAFVEPPTINSVRLISSALKLVDFKGGKIDMNKVASSLEQATYKTDQGALAVRKEDHQLITPIVVSKVAKGVKYPVDGTDMGFAPVEIIPAAEAIAFFPVQSSCKMQRTAN